MISTWRNLSAYFICKGSENMNQLYKKNEYIVIPVENNYVVINIGKIFKEGHTHVKSIGVARLLVDLAIEKRFPRNPYFVDNLIRISVDKKYIEALKEFKEDSEDVYFKKMMEDAQVCRRERGAIRRVK
jgi:hypothetical protein